MEVRPLVSQPPTHHVETVLVASTGLAQPPVEVLDEMASREPGPEPVVSVVGPAQPDSSARVTVEPQPLLELLVLLLSLDDCQGGVLAQTVAELHGSEPVQLEVAEKVAAAADVGESDGTTPSS